MTAKGSGTLGGHFYFADSFDDGSRPWTAVYTVRGDVTFRLRARGRVAEFRAGAKIGDEVGKSCLVKEFDRALRVGDGLDVAASFRIPATAGGMLSLLDIECKYCGVSAQPGIRLFMKPNRSLYLDRGKLGYDASFHQESEPLVPVNQWFDLRWRIVFGQRNDGACQIWIDEKPILATEGANFPDGSVFARYGAELGAEQYDRIQCGITANSQPNPMHIEMDDVEIIQI